MEFDNLNQNKTPLSAEELVELLDKIAADGANRINVDISNDSDGEIFVSKHKFSGRCGVNGEIGKDCE